MFEVLLWLIFALFAVSFLKACADFSQHALIADSSPMETQYPIELHVSELSFPWHTYVS